MILAVLLSCAKSGDPPAELPAEVVDGRLTGADLARRVSFAIRGVPPRADELAALEAAPDALGAHVDAWLESEEFLAVMADYHADWLQLRTDSVPQLPAIGPLTGTTTGEVFASTTGEPLRLVDHVLRERLPYTELLTADYTFADATVAVIYGLPYDPAGDVWQQVRWTDGRPAAGLLTTGEVMLRWESNTGNYNRSRANFVADKLLCANFDDRDILDAGISGSSDAEIASAIGQDPACAACHQALDPLAAYFWGFRGIIHPHQINQAYLDDCDWTWDVRTAPEPGVFSGPEAYCYPVRQYTPAYETGWADYDLPPPAAYGDPIPDLGGLARSIADDRRFSQCVTRRMTGWLAHVRPEDVPEDVVLANETALLESGFDLRALVRQIVLSEPFARTSGEPEDPFARMRIVRPEQYARSLAELTGTRWIVAADLPTCAEDPVHGNECWGPQDLLLTDRWGYRSMLGGIDGFYATLHLEGASPARLLALDQAAWTAATAVVTADLAATERTLLQVGPDASDAAVEAEIARLVLRITGEHADPGPWVDLWTQQRTEKSVHDAWIAVVAALLLDPRLEYQ